MDNDLDGLGPGGHFSVDEPRVKIKTLKRWAQRLPNGYRLKALLLSERDELSAEEFLAKMEIWMKVLDLEETG